MNVKGRQQATTRGRAPGDRRPTSLEDVTRPRAGRAPERTQTEVLTTVHAIGRAALAELEEPALAERVTADMARAIGAEVGALFLGDGPEMRLASLWADTSIGSFQGARVGAELVPTNDPVRSADISVDPADEDMDWLLRAVPDWSPRSYLAYPVLSRTGGSLGRFVFASSETDRFTARDQEVVEGVTAQVAIAFENALLLEQAEKAIRHRDEFLSIASHELKTPLTVLKGYALLLARRLRSGAVSTADVVGVAEELAGASDRLDQLVNDLLDTSRIRTERFELRPTLIDVRRLVESVVARFQHSNAGTHEFQLEFGERLVGYWDESRIDQVLTNLVSNAVRYSPDGGLVRVLVRGAGDEVVLTVTDQGIGIPRERQGQLFEPFQRLHADKRIVDGTGLGLYISQQIVDRHGGVLEVESERNAGATFTVRLPASLPDAGPPSESE